MLGFDVAAIEYGLLMNPHLFSFFSGAGFLDLGFEDEGFEVVFVNEIYEPFATAYRYSRQVKGRLDPVYGFSIESIEKLLTRRNLEKLKANVQSSRQAGAIVGFVGGPPCPDFSIAGKNLGKNGENGRLSKSYIDLIVKAKPDFFLFENVRGLYRTKIHREFFDALKRSLVKAGYSLEEKLINSIEYGAPQDRERIILIGMLKPRKEQFLSELDWATETVFDKQEVFSRNWPTEQVPRKFRKQPVGLPLELSVQHWFDRNNVTKHPNQKHVFIPRAGLARFTTVFEGDVSKKSYKRLHRWRYSPTAAYGNNEVHIHPYLPRRISVAEALAIQSLPREYELPAALTLSAMFKAVGNGVPYLAARGIARMIKKSLVREYG